MYKSLEPEEDSPDPLVAGGVPADGEDGGGIDWTISDFDAWFYNRF